MRTPLPLTRHTAILAAMLLLGPLQNGNAQTSSTPIVGFDVTKIPGLNRQGLLADLNGDGRIDIVANGGSESAPNLVVAIGRGDGTFDAPQGVHAAAAPVEIGDVNLDGRTDVVVLSTDDNLFIMPGNGDGTFGPGRLVHTLTPSAFEPRFVSAIIGVFSSTDAVPDIAVTGTDAAGNGAIFVYPGNGDFTFGTPAIQPLPERLISRARGADLDHDGVTDIVATSLCCSLYMLRNTGDMIFDFREFVMDHDLGDVRTADLNGDAHTDIVVTEFHPEFTLPPGRVAVLFGGFSATEKQEYDTGIHGEYSLALGDFTGDGQIDIATGNWSAVHDEDIGIQMWSSVSILKGTITDPATHEVTFGSPVSFTLGTVNMQGYQTSWSLEAADLNSDGRVDLVHTPGAILLNRGLVANRPPTVFAGPDETIAREDVRLLKGEATDPDGHWLDYAWSSGKKAPWEDILAHGFGLDPGVYNFTLTVDDQQGGTATDAVTITVADVNFAAVTIEPDRVVRTGQPYVLEWTTNEALRPFAYFHVSYSADGGRTFTAIPDCINLPGTARSCVWQSPGPSSDRAFLRIETAYGGQTWVDVSNQFSVATEGTSLPDGWQNRDIGIVEAPGSASYTGWFTVRGSGADVWGIADEFHYVFRSIAGDFDIVTEVAHHENLNEWTKAGLMIRGSTSPGAAHVSLFATPPLSSKGISLQSRFEAGGTSVEHARVPHSTAGAPWLRLMRRGAIVRAAYGPSSSGPWTELPAVTTSLGPTVLVGLAVSSHIDGVLATVTLGGTTITPQTSLPSGVSSGDVGPVGAAGSTSFDGSTFTVMGSGADIWGTTDEFHWVYTGVSGDFDFSARVAGVENVDRWTKAGLMIRETTSARSRHASLFATPTAEKGVAFQRRTVASGLSSHTSGPLAAPPVWLRLVRSGDVISALYRLTETVPWTLIGAETLTDLPDSVIVGLAVSSHVDGTLATATFDHVFLGQAQVYQSADVGAVGVSGTSAINAAEIRLEGSGADIWGTADAFWYYYRPWTGNGTVTVRVTSIENTDQWAKAGVMFRESLAAGSKHVMAIVSSGKGVAMQYRGSTGGTSANAGLMPGTAPEWLRLVRAGDTFTGYASDNGTTWQTLGTVTVPMSASILVGLPVTSHNNSTLATAVFENLATTQ